MTNWEWLPVPVGIDAPRWVTRADCRNVLVIVHTVASGLRLLDVVELIESDSRVQVVFSQAPDAFGNGVADFLRAVGGVVLPWQQARRERFDLALAAAYGDLHEVHAPLLVMDTAPAAVLGALLDARVGAAVEAGALVANVGNFHCLVFRLGAGGIEGIFEHHTGEVTRAKLDGFISALAQSTLQHRDVFDDMGHGALVYDPRPLEAPYFLAVTGPRRALLQGSAHQPYFAVPGGDMMLAGCFGLLRALAEAWPELGEPIRRSLAGSGGQAPWETD